MDPEVLVEAMVHTDVPLGNTETVIVKTESEHGNTETTISNTEGVHGNTEIVIVKKEAENGNTETIIVKKEAENGNTESVIVKKEAENGNTETIIVKKEAENCNTETTIGITEGDHGNTETIIVKTEAVHGNLDTPIDPCDDYGYTKTSNFTSEVFKIEVGNLPDYCGYGDLKRLMGKKLKLNPHKINVVSRIRKAYVTFKNEKDKMAALDKLNLYKLKGKELVVKSAKPKVDAMAGKKRGGDADTQQIKRLKPDISTEDELRNTVIPWWKMEYQEQLQLKQKAVCESLTDARKKISAVDRLDNEVFVWLMQQKKETGFCCPVNPILASPVIEEYRNKCGFTVGKNSKEETVVGFRLGRYRDQVSAVESPGCLVHVPEVMKQIAECFTQFITQSKLSVYNTHTHEGYWKQITVRTTQQHESMVIVSLCKQSLSDTELKEELSRMLEYISENKLDVSTLLYQVVPTHRTNNQLPCTTLTGEGVIYEQLLNLKFRISPEAFFQCNTQAAEVLYTYIGDLVKQSIQDGMAGEDVLLDICCGTGTIGLTMAGCVKRVVGLDICEEAIADADKNAKLNNISNADFHAGKAEDILPNILESMLLTKSSNLIAVVDPPRCGLHYKVIKAIRQCSAIRHLIYVSCSVDQAKNNFIDLCRPQSKRLNGAAFKPVLAQPLDLFPHTKHCELVMLFKRIEPVAKPTIHLGVATTETAVAESTVVSQTADSTMDCLP